jgi:adenosylcobinamide-phosphate synthase
MLSDHRLTPSPNAGWTMAAMSGALGVTLAKPGVYSLGHGPEPGVADIARGLALLWTASSIALVAVITVEVLKR